MDQDSSSLSSPALQQAAELLATFVPPKPIPLRTYFKEENPKEEMTTPTYVTIGGRHVELADSKQTGQQPHSIVERTEKN